MKRLKSLVLLFILAALSTSCSSYSGSGSGQNSFTYIYDDKNVNITNMIDQKPRFHVWFDSRGLPIFQHRKSNRK
jgi:hypothetical protein